MNKKELKLLFKLVDQFKEFEDNANSLKKRTTSERGYCYENGSAFAYSHCRINLKVLLLEIANKGK